MGPVRELIAKFRDSDGRVKTKTAAGILVLAGAVALAVGVLPAIASSPGPSGLGVNPAIVTYGGGSGACAFTSAGRLPSAAGFEAHTNNPMDGQISAIGPGGTTYKFNIDIHPVGPGSNDKYFDVSLDPSTPGVVIYDIVVNGGSQNTHYDFDGNGGPGTVTGDMHLHAPKKGRNDVFKLSHINICFDVPGLTLFNCDLAVTLTDPEELITIAQATIFANDTIDCRAKRASYILDNSVEPPTVTLTFAGDGTEVAAGRIDVTKDFGSTTLFEDIEYDGGPTSPAFEDVPWCVIIPKDTDPDDGDGVDGDQFDDVLTTTEYPSLPAGHIACKVFEGENAAGVQYNVIYFEFVDPSFR